ncbi:MAG: hypothetical protein M3N08_09635 [Pseudomonadota bacterium]|nr:hypothetical protein [Pseudomonadota bacterium]
MTRSKDTGSELPSKDILELINEVVPNRRRPTFVRSRATRQVTAFAQSPRLEHLNQYERLSIRALVAWAANEQRAAPETVEAMTEVHFGINHITQLPRRDYDEVVKFLIDLRIDEMKN